MVVLVATALLPLLRPILLPVVYVGDAFFRVLSGLVGAYVLAVSRLLLIYYLGMSLGVVLEVLNFDYRYLE